VTITVTCYSWAPSRGDHLFTCDAIFCPPHYLLSENNSKAASTCWVVERNSYCTEGIKPEPRCSYTIFFTNHAVLILFFLQTTLFLYTDK